MMLIASIIGGLLGFLFAATWRLLPYLCLAYAGYVILK